MADYTAACTKRAMIFLLKCIPGAVVTKERALVPADNDTSGDGCPQEWAGVVPMAGAHYPQSAFQMNRAGGTLEE